MSAHRESLFPFAPRDQPDEEEALAFVGTCQSCGAYWDVRQRKVCTCGGEVL